MTNKPDIESFRILHVLTLSGKNGEYGGPNRVAREICRALDHKKYETRIFTGALKSSIPIPETGIAEGYVIVKPLSSKFPFSSLWSTRLPISLWKQIRASHLVHIHLARDLIPILTAVICRIQSKPFVTQTHGMVVPDHRKIVLWIDKVFIKPILNSSRTNFVLTEKELGDMGPLDLRCTMTILPNGIPVLQSEPPRSVLRSNRIVFCSRVQSRKRPKLFLELARRANLDYPDLLFEIYGPDGGELAEILGELQSDPTLSNTTYKGSVEPQNVPSLLSQVDLVVLPSADEQFPMVVLESLSVGTPVLIMPSCGLAPVLKVGMPGTTCSDENLEGLITAFKSLYADNFLSGDRTKIQDFCRSTFQMDSVIQILDKTYSKILDT